MVDNPFVMSRSATDDARNLFGSVGLSSMGQNFMSPEFYNNFVGSATNRFLPGVVHASTSNTGNPTDYFNSILNSVGGVGDLKALASGAVNTATAGQSAVRQATAGMDNLEEYSGQIVDSMNQFINPYYDQVISAAMGRLQDSRDQNLLSIEDQAAAAGAYGSGRHGLVESQVYDDFSQTAGELSSNLYQRQFDTALGAAHTTEAQRLSGVNMNLQAAQMASNAQQRQMESLLQAALGAEGQRQNALGLRLGAEDRRLAGLGMQLGAEDRRLASLGLAQSAGQSLMGVADQYMGQGMTAMQQQALAGAQQQALVQELLNSGSNLFDQFTSAPEDALDIISAIMAGDPRRAEGTQTEQTSTTPGMLDYLSLATQGLGAWWGRPT